MIFSRQSFIEENENKTIEKIEYLDHYPYDNHILGPSYMDVDGGWNIL